MAELNNTLIRNIVSEIQQAERWTMDALYKIDDVPQQGRLEKIASCLLSHAFGPLFTARSVSLARRLSMELEIADQCLESGLNDLNDIGAILGTQPGTYTFSSVAFWPLGVRRGLFHFTDLRDNKGTKVKNEEIWSAFLLGNKSEGDKVIETRTPKFPSVYILEGTVLPIEVYSTRDPNSRTIYLEHNMGHRLINCRDVYEVAYPTQKFQLHI